MCFNTSNSLEDGIRMVIVKNKYLLKVKYPILENGMTTEKRDIGR